MKKYFHICLSILLLISTTGVSVSKHICGEEIHDLALYQEADNCHGEHDMNMDGCCENETGHFQVQDDFQLEYSLTVNYTADFLLYIIPVLNISLSQENHIKTFFESYESPPTPGKNILIKAQSFLL